MLQRADFTTAFLDLADDELQRPAGECRFNRLRNQFQFALQTTGNADEVGIQRAKLTFMQLLRDVLGLERPIEKPGAQRALQCLELVIDCPGPLKFVFSARRMDRFQLIFRRLFWEKSVEQQLQSAQKRLYELRPLDSKTNIRSEFRAVFGLCQQMQGFVRELELKVQSVVLEGVEQFQQKVQTSTDIDSIVKHLDEWLDYVQAGLLLNGGQQAQLMDKLLADCAIYSRYVSMSFTLSVDTDFNDGRVLSKEARKELYDQRLQKFAEEMSAHVRGNRQSVATLSKQFNDKLVAWRNI